MRVAGLAPDLNWAMAWTISSRGLPAREATAEPGAARPCVPWQAAQLAAMARAPPSLRSGGANCGAGCWAAAQAAPKAAAPAASRRKYGLMVAPLLFCARRG